MAYFYMHFKRSVFVLLFLATANLAMAQTARITGQVKDQNGQGLAGASVQIEGSGTGTVTDNNGFYSLTAAPG